MKFEKYSYTIELQINSKKILKKADLEKILKNYFKEVDIWSIDREKIYKSEPGDGPAMA
jgi:hypothetical protein